MRFLNRAISVGGPVVAAICLAACGSSGSLLSANQASELKGQLTEITNSLDSGQCQQAANKITIFRNTVDGLGVSQSLIDNLDQGASKISRLAAARCPVSPVHTRTTTTKTVTTPTTPTNTTPTTPTNTTPTTPTNTTPTTPTNTTPTPPTTTGPGSGGVGLGNGNGNGNGHGNGNGD